MTSKASTVNEYLAEITPDKQTATTKLYNTIKKNLPKGFEATMQYGMISFVVPHKLYPAGYHCKPTDALPFISLAAQKNAITIYHMGLYAKSDLLDWFQTEYPKQNVGKLDMGKSCIRFKKPENIPYTLIEALCQKVTVQNWIDSYESLYKSKG